MELVLIAMFGAFYALMIVPQQRRTKAHQALLKSLEPGDVVVTNLGIYGAVAEVEDSVVWLEVAPEIELKVALSAIAERVPDGDDDADELVEADADDGDA
ncbi:MAG: preprotein translocase subunit YajC [Acidimicrobiales bacterium]